MRPKAHPQTPSPQCKSLAIRTFRAMVSGRVISGVVPATRCLAVMPWKRREGFVGCRVRWGNREDLRLIRSRGYGRRRARDQKAHADRPPAMGGPAARRRAAMV